MNPEAIITAANLYAALGRKDKAQRVLDRLLKGYVSDEGQEPAPEPTVTLTLSEFWEACSRVKISVRDAEGYRDTPLTEYFAQPGMKPRGGTLGLLAKELGLEEK